jgi:hypothetical protein
MKNKENNRTHGMVINNGKLIYSEITIKAPVNTVWQLLTDFKSYPDWNPFVRSLKGIPKTGGRIEVKLQAPGGKPMVFKPKVLCFEENKELRWIGNLLFPWIFDGEHVFHLYENTDGSCTLQHYERFRGVLVPLLKKMLDTSTLAGFRQMNEVLKKRCETIDITV